MERISVLGLLGVVFVVLKLLGVISWSWWLVLLPFYFWIALVLAILAGVFIIGGTLQVLIWLKRFIKVTVK